MNPNIDYGTELWIKEYPTLWSGACSNLCPCNHLSYELRWEFPILGKVVGMAHGGESLGIEINGKVYGFSEPHTSYELIIKPKHDKMTKADYVKEHLEEWVGKELSDAGILIEDVMFALFATFGEEIYDDIDGFIQFAGPSDITADEIKFTLLHDIRGALHNDKLMLPRVSGYGEYSII